MDLPPCSSPPPPPCSPPVAGKAISDHGGSAAAGPSTPPPSTPNKTTWRKRPSHKGRPHLRLAKHAALKKKKQEREPAALKKKKKKQEQEPASHRRKRKDDDRSAGVDCRPPPVVRRKLDLDLDARAAFFGRATLRDNLRRLLLKLSAASVPLLGNDNEIHAPQHTSASPPHDEIHLPCAPPPGFARAQLKDNLRLLIVERNRQLPPLAAVHEEKSGKKKKKKVMVDKLELVPYRHDGRSSKRAAAADPIAMALILHDDSTGEPRLWVPRWTSEELPAHVRVPAGRRLVLGIDAAVEAASRDLALREETCIGEDPGDVPDIPKLDEKRRVLEAQVDRFMEDARSIMGDRKLSQWGGTVVDSVVGTFLTQNVSDVLSSNAFMAVSAKFSFPASSNNGSTNNVPGCASDSGVSAAAHVVGRGKRRDDRDLEELVEALRNGGISGWGRERIRKVLTGRFEDSTAGKIFNDIIASTRDTSRWKSLPEEARRNGYRREESTDDETIDWEALASAPFAVLESCIRFRGNYSQMAFRILIFLFRIKRDHGSIDLEWLRYIPRAKAKRYLLSIIGLGVKSVDCIRLLSLRHRAFPVDTNVARIVTRLGWVQLLPLDSQQFHLVGTYPIMADIQMYLEPLMCNIPTHKLYELHCQQITFGKSICTKNRPNCGACPFTADCMYYKSKFRRTMLALPGYDQQQKEGQIKSDRRIKPSIIVRPSLRQMLQYQIEMGKSTQRHCSGPIIGPSLRQMLQYQIEMGKSTQRHCSGPIIEMPISPPREYKGTLSEEEDEEEYHEIDDMEDTFREYDMEIDLRSHYTENATMGPSPGRELILSHPNASTPRMQKRCNLRTEYTAYIIPDGNKILDKFDQRVPSDVNPYLLIIRSYDEHNVNATILVPCRTATKGIFPLNGTYFQNNEVFADHSSSRMPIKIGTEDIWNLNRCTVYFGTAMKSVTKGQTLQEIQQFFHSGYICNREFDRDARVPRALSAQIHATNVQNGIGKKRCMPDSSLNSREDSEEDRVQSS